MIYADASFVVSCCVPDANAVRAALQLSKLTEPLPFTSLHRLEVRNAFELGVFRGEVSAAAAAVAEANLQEHIRFNRLRTSHVDWRFAFRDAALLSKRT